MDISPIVVIIIGITVVTSLIGFNNSSFFERYKFNVGAILKGKQWDRIVSSAFLHADYMHLIFNMMTLYFFADVVIGQFAYVSGTLFLGSIVFLSIYILSILGGDLLSLWMYRKNPNYSAIGASGGVSGILFAAIAFNPHIGIYMFFIPIAIAGWVFGILYLAYSVYGMKNQVGNVGHAAHLGGAAVGLISAIIMVPQTLSINGLYIGIMVVPLIVLGYLAYKER